MFYIRNFKYSDIKYDIYYIGTRIIGVPKKKTVVDEWYVSNLDDGQ